MRNYLTLQWSGLVPGQVEVSGKIGRESVEYILAHGDVHDGVSRCLLFSGEQVTRFGEIPVPDGLNTAQAHDYVDKEFLKMARSQVRGRVNGSGIENVEIRDDTKS